MVGRYKAVATSTKYWKPGDDYLHSITASVRGKIRNDDFLTVSEKALSTALGRLVDESTVQPSHLARLLAEYWMRIVWGYSLGLLSRLRNKTVQHLRGYPAKEGSAHKQVALWHVGFLQALMYGSEGGIDATNLPYSYVSLPLGDAEKIAQRIREKIKFELRKDVNVIIVDTDKTYSLGGFHFTHRHKTIRGIHFLGGFLAYVFGRFFRLKRRATPVAVAGCIMTVEDALEVAEVANRRRGFGAGRTVWDMAERFRVPVTHVTWSMLEKMEHKPIVIVRLKKRD